MRLLARPPAGLRCRGGTPRRQQQLGPARRHHRPRPATALQLAALPETLFSVATAAVVPLYALLLARPHARCTRRLLASDALWLGLSALYATLLALSWRADTLALAFPSDATLPLPPAFPRLTQIAQLFERPAAAAAYWVHLLAADLFVARWVLQDARRSHPPTPTAHTLVAALLFGPTALLSHVVTKWVLRQRAGWGGRTKS